MREEIIICDRCGCTTTNKCEDMRRADLSVWGRKNKKQHYIDRFDFCHKCEQTFLDFMDYEKEGQDNE